MPTAPVEVQHPVEHAHHRPGVADRGRVVKTLTFWLRPAFALRVLGRFQQIAGFDRAIALASSALTGLPIVEAPDGPMVPPELAGGAALVFTG